MLPTNAIIDIYRGFNAGSPYPPTSATPAATDFPGHLRHHVRHGRFGSAAALKWTHVLYLSSGVDIRSAYNSQLNTGQPANADTVLLADYPLPGWCTAFLVVLVQRVRRGPGDFVRVYLDRMQPRQGACTTSGILLPCCPDPLPATIHATIPTGSGCPCLDGTVVELTYDSGTQTWSGSSVVCSSETLTIEFQCGSTSCADATVSVSLDNHGSVGPVTVSAGCSCDPLNMVFNDINFPILGSECDGAISVVITA